VAQVESLLEDPDFFGDVRAVRQDLAFYHQARVQFTSSVVSPWKRNNTVTGALHDRQTMAEQAGGYLIHG